MVDRKEQLEDVSLERNEEIQEIIQRMPYGFGVKISIFICVIVATLMLFGWFINYPDVVLGSITINSNSAPIKLVSNMSGRLYLGDTENSTVVKEGDFIGIIQNGAKSEDIIKVSQLVDQVNLRSDIDRKTFLKFPKNPSLGELNVKYYAFVNAFSQLLLFEEQSFYDKQAVVLNSLMEEYSKLLDIANARRLIGDESLRLVNKFASRDSLLFAQKVISEAENDKTKISAVSALDAQKATLREISSLNSERQKMQWQLESNYLQKVEKQQQLALNLASTFTELYDYLKIWKQNYTFQSPINGTVEFAKFWTNDQYIKRDEAVFTIVPTQTTTIGQMLLPVNGAGKVKVGQEVVIKLDDYPYLEYGTVKGVVSSISLTSNSLATINGNMEYYLANVELPDKLKTNFGNVLQFKFEAKGSAEIIVNKRRLFERLFDNLKYRVN